MNIENIWIVFVTVIVAPLSFGIINRTKAVFAGRKGKPILLAYYDIAKLIRKGAVYGKTTGPIFRWSPAIVLGSLLLAVLIIPWGNIEAPISFTGDFVLLAYLIGVSRFFTVLAALDTGSSFEGMGASREVQFSAFGEPTLLLGMLLLAVYTGETSLSKMISSINVEVWLSFHAALVLLIIAWMLLLLFENSRIPVDDPNTHLELTMIHEVMLLDTGGPDLGVMTIASSLKLFIFSALISNLLIPYRAEDPAIQAALFLSGIVLTALTVGIVESTMGRIRIIRLPKMLIGSTVMIATALVMKLAS